LGFRQRGRYRRDWSKQDQRIVPCREKSPPLPELRSFRIDCVDHQRAPSDQVRRLNTPLKSMLQQTGADAAPGVSGIGRKLAE